MSPLPASFWDDAPDPRSLPVLSCEPVFFKKAGTKRFRRGEVTYNAAGFWLTYRDSTQKTVTHSLTLGSDDGDPCAGWVEGERISLHMKTAKEVLMAAMKGSCEDSEPHQIREH